MAPAVRTNLARWQQRARSIPDPPLRRIALGKLTQERFNVEVAATLATLAPRERRAEAVEAIVALQIAYDYLDLLTECPTLAGSERGVSLLDELATAMGAERSGTAGESYLHALLDAVQATFAELPSAARVRAVAARSAARCAQAQALTHASASAAGEQAFRDWAMQQAQLHPLGWRELAAGSSASVLCLHALIAAATQKHFDTQDAETLEQLYLTIGALSMLDSLLDEEADLAAGARSWRSRYRDEHEMAQALAHTAATAKACALHAPDGAHHLLTIGGIVAYYASAKPPGLRKGDPLARALGAELGATLAGPMLVMRLWRLAKAIRRSQA
ncbi:MAG: DUF2600 family protein [Solirubrobacteraceae bacterium]